MTVAYPLPRQTGHADFPHPAFAKVVRQAHSQADESQASKVVVVAFIGRWIPSALTASFEMLMQSFEHIRVNVAHGIARITQAEVSAPSVQMTIEFSDQLGQWHMAAMESELLMEHGSLTSQRSARRHQVPVTLVAS